MKPKIILCVAVVLSFMLSGCASSAPADAGDDQITNATMEALFDKAVISSGRNYVECERQLLAADDSVLATLQTHLRSPDPIARLLAQVLLDGKKGQTNDYNKVAEYLAWLVKRAPVSEGGPPSPPMLAHSLAKAFDGRVADFLALRLVKEDTENLPGWLRAGMILYLQQQKSPSTTAALLRFALETDDERLRDSAIDAIKGIHDPELRKKLEAEREYARKQHLQWPSAMETLQDSRVSPDGRFRVATMLTDRGFKHVADAHLGGRDIHLCPGEAFSRTLSFPVLAGDAGTWAAWLFLEDIRTEGTNSQPGVASVQVIFDGTHTNTVYFSNQGGWAGPYFSFLPWADTSVTHTVAILNNYTNCIWIGDVFSRWAMNANTNSANMHVADALIATNIQISAGGHFDGSLAFPVQGGDLGTWACWLMCEGVETGTVSPLPGQSRIKLWLDGHDYTTLALNNQGVQQTLQEAITWEQFIGNSLTIDPRAIHTFVLQNLDAAPLTIDNLWVRYFVNREVNMDRQGR